MYTVLMAVHVVLAIALVALVLIQRGKGADVGAAFGSGASSTVFGSQGSASFLTRATAVLATLFFVTSLSLAYLVSQTGQATSVTDLLAPAQQSPASELDGGVPAAPTTQAPSPADVPVIPEEEPQPK